MDRAQTNTLYKHWRYEQDAQGLVWLTFDKQGESTNTFSREALDELSAALDAIKALAPKGYALTERLCVYPQYMTPEWLDQGVLDVVKRKYWSFIPRRGSGRREERPIRRDLVPEPPDLQMQQRHLGAASRPGLLES